MLFLLLPEFLVLTVLNVILSASYPSGSSFSTIVSKYSDMFALLIAPPLVSRSVVSSVSSNDLYHFLSLCTPSWVVFDSYINGLSVVIELFTSIIFLALLNIMEFETYTLVYSICNELYRSRYSRLSTRVVAFSLAKSSLATSYSALVI